MQFHARKILTILCRECESFAALDCLVYTCCALSVWHPSVTHNACTLIMNNINYYYNKLHKNILQFYNSTISTVSYINEPILVYGQSTGRRQPRIGYFVHTLPIHSEEGDLVLMV